MCLILIMFSLFPTVIFSYNGRPVVQGKVDKSKLTTLQEHQWHVFLDDYPRFRCYAAMQNITLPVDYKVQSHCLEPKTITYTGRPLFSGDKVNTSKFTADNEHMFHKILQENPQYRCYAAMANLSLRIDYEVPPGCPVEFKSAVSDDSTLIKYITLSIVVLVVIVLIMLVMYNYYRRKSCLNNRSIRKLNKEIIYYKDDTTEDDTSEV